MKDKNAGLFVNWIKNFTIIVFTQSFHAIFMLFILKLMSEIQKKDIATGAVSSASGMLSIIAIAASMALIKFEKLIKNMFGIKDSNLMGGIGDNLAKSLVAIRSAQDIGKRTLEPVRNYADGIKKRRNIKSQIDALNNKTSSQSNISTSVGNNSLVDRNGTNYTTNTLQNSSSSENSENSNSSEKKHSISDLIDALENNTDAHNDNTSEMKNKTDKSDADKLSDLKQQLLENETEQRKNFLQMFTRTGSSIAAAGIGIGATDDIQSAVTVSNIIDKPLDATSDHIVNNTVYKSASNEITTRIDNVSKKIREDNSSLTAAEVQKMIEKQTDYLKNTKSSLEGKKSINTKELSAEIWKSMKKEMPKHSKIIDVEKSSRNKRKSSVEDA